MTRLLHLLEELRLTSRSADDWLKHRLSDLVRALAQSHGAELVQHLDPALLVAEVVGNRALLAQVLEQATDKALMDEVRDRGLKLEDE